LCFLVLGSMNIFGQEITIEAKNEPINQILTDLRDQYQLNISFDNNLLSTYLLTISGDFQSPDDAIQALLKSLPLDFEKKDGVYIIFPKKYEPKKPSTFYLSGMILERGSLEPLPYSHILINGRGTISDLAGSFSYSTNEDSVFSVQISHLGYYIIDTILPASSNLQLLLTPSVIGLTEIEIINKIPEMATQIGEQAGLMKLNGKIASFLPGYGDNSVFNLLRLQPGILASGEQTNELIIWGSYAGQSKVVFDGFTVYGLKNFNDNISSF